MTTDNTKMVVISCDELRTLIKNEVSKISEAYNSNVTKINHLTIKPLSIKEVAERYDISKQTVHNWLKQGIITGFKQGKGRYFYLHELDQKLTHYQYIKPTAVNGQLEERKRPVYQAM